MGTCTYTLVAVCNDTGVTNFTVTAKNEERGLPNASYLKHVIIDIAGHRITLQKSHRVLINGKRTRTPIVGAVPGVQIGMQGSYVLVVTDFGLVVKFDGVHHLAISIPSTYSRKVCGMCGNYNGNLDDDDLMPNGESAPSTALLGDSWRAAGDTDAGCQPAATPDGCDAADNELYGRMCKIIVSSSGPFASCHNVVDPALFFQSCVFDVCQYGGMESTLCHILQAYAEACRAENVDVLWRNETFCPPSCPPNTHYTPCASPCPATCSDIHAEAGCQSVARCAEGCVCDQGFVLSDDLCVSLEACGCRDGENNYHSFGESWLTDDCSASCTCEALGAVWCSTHGCTMGETCELKDGNYICKPIGYGTCTVSGDPHYQSFDGRLYHFMGEETYVLAESCGWDEGRLAPVRVLGRNERRGNQAVSYLAEVRVFVLGHEVRFTKRNDFQVEGVRTKPPASPAEGLHIQQSSHKFILRTDFGLTVTFDRKEHADVVMPSSYMSRLCGLCGNYNGNASDDLSTRDGQLAASTDEFGHSWRVADDARHAPARSNEQRVFRREAPSWMQDDFDGLSCGAGQLAELQGATACGIMKEAEGPFGQCLDEVPPAHYFTNCLYDMCENIEDRETFCSSLEVYAAACQQQSITPRSWRNVTGCEPTCPLNSVYVERMSACPSTCGDLAASSNCELPDVEGCQCMPGFVMSGFDCIPFTQCGCLYENSYREAGETFYASGCNKNCTCMKANLVQCTDTSCGANELCTVGDFTIGCFADDPCAHVTCENGGTCSSLSGQQVTCQCPPPFTGDRCESTMSPASTASPGDLCAAGNTCLNGGSCTEVGGQIHCRCPDFYTGDRCETKDATVTIIIAVVCSVGGVLIIVVVTVLLVKYLRNRSKSQLLQEEGDDDDDIITVASGSSTPRFNYDNSEFNVEFTSSDPWNARLND
ncbi:zonadhesin-like [Petromyzon marinus]|uniref:zonadhesin-like n=1 Tax=Petromyzon marinus TaxID=7757 RepID=UPI003F71C2B7